MKQDSEALSLGQALSVLRRRAPLIVLCVAVVAGAAFGFSKHQTKQYTATASLVFNNNPLSQQIAGLPPNTSNQLIQQTSNIELVGLGNIAAKTAILLGHGLTEELVGKSLSIVGQGESNIVSVSATAASPVLAAKIATTYTRQFAKEQRKTNSQFFRSALAVINKQLAALPPVQRFGETGVALQNHAQTLQFLSELQYGNVQVAQKAPVPTTPSSPKTSKNTFLGGVLGLFLGLGLAFVLERLKRTHWIRDPEDLEETYDLPQLGAIPESPVLARSTRSGGSKSAVLTHAEVEAFQLIRARLRFFNIDRDLRTVLVTSATRGDGKTTVSLRMAEAAAMMGSRVLLLEADFRNPVLAQRLDLEPGPDLPDVLTGAALIDEAIQSLNLELPTGNDTAQRTLNVLPCSTAPPVNPGALIESQAMGAVLDYVKSTYDLVVIDTPPLTAVSDGFPLLRKVDGVVIVSWVGRSRRDLAIQLHQNLMSSHASLLGVIANGVKPRVMGNYAYNDTAGGKWPLPSTSSTNGLSSSDAPTSTVNI